MSLDLTGYDFTKTPASWPYSWTVDERHLAGLHTLALGCVGDVVEIGCFRGRSTVAFTQALDTGANFDLHLVDVKITPEVRQVVSMCKHPERIHIHETHSTNFALHRPALVFIDADHGWPAVLDVLNAVVSGTEIIVMHDTRAHQYGFKQCEGSSLAAEALRHAVDRPWIEDYSMRKGELTHRGLMASFQPEAYGEYGAAFLQTIKDYQP